MRGAFIAAVWTAMGAAGCTTPNPAYCDESTDCTSAEAPYCDLPNNTCTATPDASVGLPDATPDAGPPTCESLGAECGLIGDGHGGTLDCGGCTIPGEGCGDGGEPNKCGCVEGEWHVEEIDDVGPRGGAIVVSADGTLHVAYESAEDNHLKYAFRPSDAGEWTIEVAASGDPHGLSPTIAVGPDGTPHLLDWAAGAGPTHSVRNSDGAWTTEIVDPGTATSFTGRTAVAIDTAGKIHACYVAGLGSAGPLRYAAHTVGGDWVPTADIDNLDDIGQCSIDVAADGVAHLLYADTFANDLLHSEVDSEGTITTDTVSISSGNSFSMALANDGTIHTVYTDGSGDIRHRYRNLGVSWNDEQIDTGASFPIVRWVNGILFVAYIELASGDARIAMSPTPGDWTMAPAFSDEDGISQLDMYIEPTGAVHVAYVSGAGLNYGRRCPAE